MVADNAPGLSPGYILAPRKVRKGHMTRAGVSCGRDSWGAGGGSVLHTGSCPKPYPLSANTSAAPQDWPSTESSGIGRFCPPWGRSVEGQCCLGPEPPTVEPCAPNQRDYGTPDTFHPPSNPRDMDSMRRDLGTNAWCTPSPKPLPFSAG